MGLKRLLTAIGKTILVLATLAGMVQFYFLYKPMCSIKQGYSTDYSNPFATRFLICNGGYFSYYNLGASVKLLNAVNPVLHIQLHDMTLLNFDKIVDELESGKTQTITLPDVTPALFPPESLRVNIRLCANYETRFLFFHKPHSDTSNFETMQTSDGNYTWIERY